MKKKKNLAEQCHEPLPSWKAVEEDPLAAEYREILLKTENELTIKDICYLIRQGFIPDVAFPKMIQSLKENPLCGEYYDGEGVYSLSAFKCWTPERKEEARKILPILESGKNKFVHVIGADTYRKNLKTLKKVLDSWGHETNGLSIPKLCRILQFC